MKERAGRLQSLRDENDCGQHRKNNEHDRERDRDIDRTLEKPVQRIFQRFLAQSDKTEAAVFKVRHRMAQPFFQIAQDEQADAKLIANLDDVLVRFGKEWEFEENDLSNVVIADDLFEVLGPSEEWNSRIVDLFVVRNQTDGPQTDFGFALKPFTQLRGSLARADQKCFVFPTKNSPG